MATPGGVVRKYLRGNPTLLLGQVAAMMHLSSIELKAELSKEGLTFAGIRKELNSLSMTFTVDEWRLIAAACGKAKPSAFIDGARTIPKLKAIALKIATQTGNHND